MFSKFESNTSLAPLTTLSIGGKARYLTVVRSVEEMQKTLLFCKEQKMPYIILGKGSNSLFLDSGFPGLVIQNKIDFLKELAPTVIQVGAGYSFSLLGTQTAKKNLSGLEFAVGIPGSVGGAVFMNAGAQGESTNKVLLSCDFVDEEGKLHTYTKETLQFGYRFSTFQRLKGAIVSATFGLSFCSAAALKTRELLEYRLRTQPYHEKSAGCIFRNPVGVSAGELIDKCGLKGYMIGGAKVSDMHANFLINAGNATAEDMLGLIELVQMRVKEATGYALEKELCVHRHE